MKELKFLLLLLFGYLIVFIEFADFQNILFSIYYFVTDLISPHHIMPDIYARFLTGLAILISFMLIMESTIGRK